MNKKLHILFLSGWYPSRVFPTNGDFVQRHAEAVATQHKVTTIHVVSDKKLKKKSEISEFKKRNVSTKIIYVPYTNSALIKFIYFFKSYLSTIRKIDDFNLVHLNITFPKGIIALYLKWFRNKQYIISEHWSDYQYPLNKTIGVFQKIITKLIIKNAKFICPVTKHLEIEMIRFGLKGNYQPVPNVVDTSIFNYSKNKVDSFTITHISGMEDKIKNVSGIIKVVSTLQNKIPNLQFNLVGENSTKYKDLAKNYSIKNVSLINHISSAKVANYLQKSSVLVLFSNYENLPCVILESFACGVPVISTNVGGINEYFPEKFGYLINVNDEIALEIAFLKIFNKEISPKKKQMNEFAKKYFGYKAISNSFTLLYEKSLKKSN